MTYWLTGWNRRKQITINGSTAGAQSDYQMKLTVYQASGTDSTGVVHLAGNVLTTFNDLRFTKSDGNTTLYYWIESITGTSPNLIVSVWIKLAPSPDTIPASPGSYNFYIYYNNTSATSVSNGTNTFPVLFDDFSGTLSKWTQENNSTYGGGTVGISSNTLYMTRTSSSWGCGVTTPISQAYGAWHAKLYKTSGTQAGNALTLYIIDTNRYYTLYYYPDSGGTIKLYGSTQIGSTITSVTTSAWHTFDITRDSSGNWTVYIDNVSRITGTDNTVGTCDKLGIRTGSWPSGSTDYADDIFYRKYVSPEPTFSTIGIEETVTCGTPSANLIVLEIVSNQLLRQYPSFIDLDAISNLINDKY